MPEPTHSLLKAEQSELAIKAKDGDQRAANRLLRSMEGYVKVVARRYARASGMPVEDIQQAARMGIVLAIPRFDPSRGHFSAAASYWIMQEIRKATDKQRDPIVFPDSRNIKALKYRLPVIYARYLAEGLSEEAAIDRSAYDLGVNPQEVRNFMAARCPSSVVVDSGYSSVEAPDSQSNGVSRAISGAMSALSQTDQEIVRARIEGSSLPELSKRFGISTRKLSERYKQSLLILREEMIGDGFVLSDLV